MKKLELKKHIADLKAYNKSLLIELEKTREALYNSKEQEVFQNEYGHFTHQKPDIGACESCYFDKDGRICPPECSSVIGSRYYYIDNIGTDKPEPEPEPEQEPEQEPNQDVFQNKYGHYVRIPCNGRSCTICAYQINKTCTLYFSPFNAASECRSEIGAGYYLDKIGGQNE